MKKIWLIVLPVLVVAVVAGWAYSHPEKVAHPEAMAMADAFSMAGQGYRLGVVLSDSPRSGDDSKRGVVISEVLSDSPAEKAGMKEGDTIVRMNGKEIETERDIRRMLRDLDGPNPLEVEVLRDNKPLKIVVTPDKREFTMLRNFSGNHIGVELQQMDSDLSRYFQTEPGAGLLIAHVDKDSPADEAGLKSGDVITAVNGKKVTAQKDLRKALNEVKEGETADLTILRHGKSQRVSVKPEHRQFNMPHLGELRELGELPEIGSLPELRNLPELRDLPNRPEFRESMQDLKREMEQLKREMEELKRDLRDKD